MIWNHHSRTETTAAANYCKWRSRRCRPNTKTSVKPSFLEYLAMATAGRNCGRVDQANIGFGFRAADAGSSEGPRTARCSWLAVPCLSQMDPRHWKRAIAPNGKVLVDGQDVPSEYRSVPFHRLRAFILVAHSPTWHASGHPSSKRHHWATMRTVTLPVEGGRQLKIKKCDLTIRFKW